MEDFTIKQIMMTCFDMGQKAAYDVQIARKDHDALKLSHQDMAEDLKAARKKNAELEAENASLKVAKAA